MENKYDVVIVGGGPGGLFCAKILAKSGKRILLLEKNPLIGPKACAGGLTRKSLDFLNLPENIGGKRFDKISFKVGKQKTDLDAGDNFVCTVTREELGQWQKKELENSSVEIRVNARVTNISQNEITVNNSEKIKFDFLVGADGSNSSVRKYLGLKSKWLGTGIYYVVKDLKRNIEIYFDWKLFSAWYAWIFPYGKESATVGTAAFGKILPLGKAKKNLEAWLKSNKIGYQEKDFVAHPINCDYRGYRFGNVFLVGDAAGLASPFTGEGIYQALVSGEVVARQILDPKYSTKKIRALRCQQRAHYFCLVALWLLGPLKQLIFRLITFVVKNKYIARFLLWILV